MVALQRYARPGSPLATYRYGLGSQIQSVIDEHIALRIFYAYKFVKASISLYSILPFLLTKRLLRFLFFLSSHTFSFKSLISHFHSQGVLIFRH